MASNENKASLQVNFQLVLQKDNKGKYTIKDGKVVGRNIVIPVPKGVARKIGLLEPEVKLRS